MEQKTKALKTSSKVIAIIMKIGYIAMIVAMSICAAALVFMAVTGGKTSFLTVGGTEIIVADELSTTPAAFAAMCAELLVAGGFVLAVLLLTYRMFHEISRTGDPFTKKYVRMIRAIGILFASMTVAMGIAEGIVSSFTSEALEAKSHGPGLVVAVIIFCFSYIIDYGCALKEQTEEKQ